MFSASSFTLLVIAAASFSRAESIAKRQSSTIAQHGIFYCSGQNLGGDCGSLVVLDNVCTEPSSEFNDNMRSAVIPLFTTCQFYADPYCQNQLASVTNSPGSGWQPYYDPNPSGASNGVTNIRCTVPANAPASQLAVASVQHPLQEIQVYYTLDVWWEGTAGTQTVLDGVCAEIPQAFNDGISSFRVTAGGAASCVLYSDYFCTGAQAAIPYNGGQGSDTVNSLGDPDDATTFMCTL